MINDECLQMRSSVNDVRFKELIQLCNAIDSRKDFDDYTFKLFAGE